MSPSERPQSAATAGDESGSLTQPNWAVTMFSLTTELVSAYRTPLQLIEDLADSGVTDTIEIDGPQHFSTFPRFAEDEIDAFRETVSRRGLALSMLGIYNDPAARRGEVFGLDESERFVVAQLEGAARLGYSLTRIAFPTDPALIERLLPHAERLGVSVLQEVQGAARPDSAAFEAARSQLQRLGSDRLGFVFDLSACMAGLPVTYLEELRRLGIPRPAVDHLENTWGEEDDASVRAEVDRLVGEASLTPAARVRLSMPFGRFGHTSVADWREALPEFDAVHLKYWDLEDAGGRVSGPITDLRREFGSIGYSGVITSEWGGHEWLDESGIEMTRRHRALYDGAVPRQR